MWPPTSWGRPGLGKAATEPAPLAICSMISTILCGPTVQLASVRSAPQEEISRAARPGSPSASVLDEGLVRHDRRAQGPDRLIGEPQLDEVGEGLKEDRICSAFEERFGLLQKEGLRPVCTVGTNRGERTSERTDGPEDQGPVPCSCDSTGRLEGQAGALGVYFAHPLFQVVVLQLETVGGESVGLYGVSACPQILHVNIRDHLRVREF